MRPLTATIRLANLRHNYRLLKQHHGGKLLAVVKANAYGHGAVVCARALAGLADGFAVATPDEGMELRQAGITLPIVLLEGVFEADEYAHVDRHRLWPVVQNHWQLQALLAHNWQNPVTVWLKMDSGMHRAGIAPADFAEADRLLAAHPAVADIIHMSHFARADEPDCGSTAEQTAVFDDAVPCLRQQSLANSAAILGHPAARRDWGRAGIALYGLEPFPDACAGLKPVMRLSSRVFSERLLDSGQAVGYAAAFTTDTPTRVGLIAGGYADGYPRHIPAQNCPVAIDGTTSDIIGRVSMDMITVRLNRPEQGIGSEVELWGDRISANTVAAAAETISYELLCNVKRARFVYED